MDPYGGTDPLGMFPLFRNRTADVMDPRLSVVFRLLVRLGSFPLAGDRPMSLISIRPELSKVFEPLESVRLGRFMEGNGMLPTTQFAY